MITPGAYQVIHGENLQVSEMQIERFNLARLQAGEAREDLTEEVQKVREKVHAGAEGAEG